MATGAAEAQEPPLEWQRSSWPTEKPPGYDLTFDSWGPTIPGSSVENTANYLATEQVEATPQTRDESSGDWLYKHIEIHDDNGTPIGYMAVGYSQFVNWSQNDGCALADPVELSRPDPLVGIERPEHRRGQTLGLLARYELDGTPTWFKTFAPGILFDIIQDSQGKIVVIGSGKNLKQRIGEPVHTVRFNPTATGDPISDLAGHQCDEGRASLMTVMKLDLNGDILWKHLYSPFDNLPEALTKRVQGHGLIETRIGGALGYRVVGFGTTISDVKQVFVADLDGNGLVNWKTLYGTLPGSGISDTFNSQALRISRAPVSVGEYYAISGFRLMSGSAKSSAFLWVMHDDQDLYLKDTRMTTDFPLTTQGLNQNSNGVFFQLEGTVPYVIWPILADFTTNGSSNGQV